MSDEQLRKDLIRELRDHQRRIEALEQRRLPANAVCLFPGGSFGQILTKASDDDCATFWGDPGGSPPPEELAFAHFWWDGGGDPPETGGGSWEMVDTGIVGDQIFGLNLDGRPSVLVDSVVSATYFARATTGDDFSADNDPIAAFRAYMLGMSQFGPNGGIGDVDIDHYVFVPIETFGGSPATEAQGYFTAVGPCAAGTEFRFRLYSGFSGVSAAWQVWVKLAALS